MNKKQRNNLLIALGILVGIVMTMVGLGMGLYYFL